MLTMDPAALRKTLEQLEHATDDHIQWHENLLRVIVCGSAFELNDLEDGAHVHCRLGRWYYEQAPAELWGNPAFAAIGTEHECLHRIAAQLLRDVVANEPASTATRLPMKVRFSKPWKRPKSASSWSCC